MSKTYDVVRQFEQRVAAYAGSRYAVAVDTCSAALQLCCQYHHVQQVCLPRHTYISVPFAVMHAGGNVSFDARQWTGAYRLFPYPIVDSAMRFTKGMYEADKFQCVSFHSKKILPIGRGGMILTNDADAVLWFKQMRWDGRSEMPFKDDNVCMAGWPFSMEPERAARGMVLMDHLPERNADLPNDHPDISKFKVFHS